VDISSIDEVYPRKGYNSYSLRLIGRRQVLNELRFFNYLKSRYSQTEYIGDISILGIIMNTNIQRVDFSKSIPTLHYIKADWLEQLGQTRFLTRCQNGEISWGELHAFIQQHQFYSRGFTRYLAALLANIEDDDHRLALTQNLFDEMGLGDAGNVPHSKLYQNMMNSMGLTTSSNPLLNQLCYWLDAATRVKQALQVRQ
jgi:hypothetical protein